MKRNHKGHDPQDRRGRLLLTAMLGAALTVSGAQVAAASPANSEECSELSYPALFGDLPAPPNLIAVYDPDAPLGTPPTLILPATAPLPEDDGFVAIAPHITILNFCPQLAHGRVPAGQPRAGWWWIQNTRPEGGFSHFLTINEPGNAWAISLRPQQRLYFEHPNVTIRC